MHSCSVARRECRATAAQGVRAGTAYLPAVACLAMAGGADGFDREERGRLAEAEAVEPSSLLPPTVAAAAHVLCFVMID